LKEGAERVMLALMGKSQKPGKSVPRTGIKAHESKAGKPSALLDTRVVYCGLRRAQSSRDNLEQLAKLPDACIDLIYIDPPFNSNQNHKVSGIL